MDELAPVQSFLLEKGVDKLHDVGGLSCCFQWGAKQQVLFDALVVDVSNEDN
jgi:hypothetical protein